MAVWKIELSAPDVNENGVAHGRSPNGTERALRRAVATI